MPCLQVTSTVLDSPVAMYQGWGYDAWPHASRTPGPHSWMASDGVSQRWSDYAHPTRTSLERADADSTTASASMVASWAASLSSTQPAARRDSLAGLPHSLAWEGSLESSSSPSSILAKSASASCAKRTEPEEAMSSSHRLSASSASSLSRLEAQSPSFDLPTSAFSPSPAVDIGEGDKDKPGGQGRQQQKRAPASSSSSSCWGEGTDPPASQWDGGGGGTPSSPFRVPKARHAAPAPAETPKLEGTAVGSAQWDSGSAFSSTTPGAVGPSAAAPGSGSVQCGSGSGTGTKGAGTEKSWMAGDCALSGGASKSLAFGSHSLKQESVGIFDDAKHLSEYQAFGLQAASSSAVVSAANPFACSMPGPGSAYGYGYPPMFPESKGFNAGWSDPYVDPHYAQFQGRFDFVFLVLQGLCCVHDVQ